MNILVPNLGSTSLKYKLFRGGSETAIVRGKIERIGSSDSVATAFHGGRTSRTVCAIASHSDALLHLLHHLHSLAAVGEDISVDVIALKAVHAGPKYRGTFLVDDSLLAAMEEFLPVAPLHNAIYLSAIRSFRSSAPKVPIVAVFESGFHSTMPEYAQVYGIPYEWIQHYGILRYGFHGASHSYIARRVLELLNCDAAGLRLISCHLGGSSSLCAIRDGKSVDCSFGFSPQSGIDHSTRNGDLDPFVIPFVASRTGDSQEAVLASLSKRGGLLGISGLSGDCADLERTAAAGNQRSVLALEVFTYTVRKYIGAFTAALGGLDVLVFTGGIGEHSGFVRQHVCEGLQYLGIVLDPERNAHVGDDDCEISASQGRIRVLVIATDEELVVAREAAILLGRKTEAAPVQVA